MKKTLLDEQYEKLKKKEMPDGWDLYILESNMQDFKRRIKDFSKLIKEHYKWLNKNMDDHNQYLQECLDESNKIKDKISEKLKLAMRRAMK